MALTTYAGLIAAVPAWLTRSDATETKIIDWIALAEARIGRELRINTMLTRTTASISSEYSAVPTDFLQALSFRLADSPYTRIAYITPEAMSQMHEDRVSGDTPCYYTQIGGEFWFSPVPNAAVDAELIYYARLPALTTTNTTNWMLTSHPDAYLRGTLLEASIYYEDDENIAKYESLFGQSLTAIAMGANRDMTAGNLMPTISSGYV